MISKLGKKHLGMELCKVCINHDTGVIYMHITILVKQVYWYMYISQISGERLQDHWSSGLNDWKPTSVRQ